VSERAEAGEALTSRSASFNQKILHHARILVRQDVLHNRSQLQRTTELQTGGGWRSFHSVLKIASQPRCHMVLPFTGVRYELRILGIRHL